MTERLADSNVVQGSGPYSIGSPMWAGMSKLIEEMGELQQVLGKLIGTGGQVDHWDGTNLLDRLCDELADLEAAVIFFVDENDLNYTVITERRDEKLALFRKWHEEGK